MGAVEQEHKTRKGNTARSACYEFLTLAPANSLKNELVDLIKVSARSTTMNTQSSRTRANFSTPETFFVPSMDAGRELPVDALNCTIQRAESVVHLLMSQFEDEAGSRLNDDIIIDALSNVLGHLEMIDAMLRHTWEQTIMASPINPADIPFKDAP